MPKGKKTYQSRIDVSASSEISGDGEKFISATIKAEKKLFETLSILEERGGVISLEKRIERAIKAEVLKSLREVDEFFKLLRGKQRRRVSAKEIAQEQ